jgi:hypothetical protein
VGRAVDDDQAEAVALQPRACWSANGLNQLKTRVKL